VFPSLTKYLADRRLYRRDENDQVVKVRDNLQDATRCLVLGFPAMITKPDDDEEEDRFCRSGFLSGPNAWMA